MKRRKIVVGAVAIIIGLPVVLALVTWVSFYALVSSFAPNRTNGTIVSSGEKREYLLYVPRSYDRAKPTPLVISMHAAMNWPAFQMKLSQWNKVADENGFIVVYPAGERDVQRRRHGIRAFLHVVSPDRRYRGRVRGSITAV